MIVVQISIILMRFLVFFDEIILKARQIFLQGIFFAFN